MREKTEHMSWRNFEFARFLSYFRERDGDRLVRAILFVVMIFAAFRLRMWRNRRIT
jgi:hypothetical protein